jgi:hypothetical protein
LDGEITPDVIQAPRLATIRLFGAGCGTTLPHMSIFPLLNKIEVEATNDHEWNGLSTYIDQFPSLSTIHFLYPTGQSPGKKDQVYVVRDAGFVVSAFHFDPNTAWNFGVYQYQEIQLDS